MPRRSRTGIRGYYVDAQGRRRIDLPYVDSNGVERRHQERFPPGTPARAAETRAREVLAKATTRTLTAKAASSDVRTLEQAFDQYLEWRETNRPKNWKRIRSVARAFVLTLGDIPIVTFDPAAIERHKAKRARSKSTKPATINKDVRTAKHMAGIAVRLGWPWMTAERAALIRQVPMLREPPGRQRELSPDDVAAIFAAFTRKNSRFARRVALAALLSGMRLGEILDLTDDRVDLRRGVITIHKTKQNRIHAVTISDPMRELLRESMAEPGRPKGVVFPSSRGAAYTVDGFSKSFARVAERAKVGDVTFHDLRRHVGTSLINAGVDIKTVSGILGHATTAPTERSYAHLRVESTREAVAKLPAITFAFPSPAPKAVKAARKKAS